MLWDPIRSKWVAATPEEQVRQQLLLKMTGEWGFPPSLIAIEKEIRDRRFDILCYRKKGENLVPLLLIECKAERGDSEAFHQALGYNSGLSAPFICLASREKIETFWRESGKIVSVPFLPSYEQLLTYV